MGMIMVEKLYDDLNDNDIWTTDGLQWHPYALKGKEGQATDIEPYKAKIFVPGYSIPDEFFN
jgi:hypothetical protein